MNLIVTSNFTDGIFLRYALFHRLGRENEPVGRDLGPQTRTEQQMSDNGVRISRNRNGSKAKGLSRRSLLKTGAAAVRAPIGSEPITRFPTIPAQEIQDIEHHHVGVS